MMNHWHRKIEHLSFFRHKYKGSFKDIIKEIKKLGIKINAYKDGFQLSEKGITIGVLWNHAIIFYVDYNNISAKLLDTLDKYYEDAINYIYIGNLINGDD